MKARGIKPEWEVFGLADIVQDVQRAINDGLDDAPHFINIVIGANAFQGALPYTPRLLQAMVDHLPRDTVFYDLFEKAAAVIVRAAEAYAHLAADYGGIELRRG